METLPHDWLALMMLVFTLGLKHGMDPDHLATVDGLTRCNAGTRPRLSRWCGFLFSLGHGTVVTLMAVAVGLVAKRWIIPSWVDDVGAWVSIVFLLALGWINLAAVLNTHPSQVVQPVGLKGRWLGRLSRASHPLVVVLVGALFALSFDTLTQTAVFSLAATSVGGWGYSTLLGVIFMAGMMVTDGINGLWISRLVRRADQRALIASRVMGLVVAGLSLLVGAFGIAKYFFPAVAERSEGRELMFGLVVVAIVALSFLVAVRLAARPAAQKAAILISERN